MKSYRGAKFKSRSYILPFLTPVQYLALPCLAFLVPAGVHDRVGTCGVQYVMETAAAVARRLCPSASAAPASLSGHLCCGARPLTPRGTRLPASRSSPHTLPAQRPTLARLLNRPCRDSFRRRGAAKSPEYPASAVNRSGNLPALRMAPPAPLPRLPSIRAYLLTSDFPRSVPSSSDPVTADKPTVAAVVDIFFFLALEMADHTGALTVPETVAQSRVSTHTSATSSHAVPPPPPLPPSLLLSQHVPTLFLLTHATLSSLSLSLSPPSRRRPRARDDRTRTRGDRAQTRDDRARGNGSRVNRAQDLRGVRICCRRETVVVRCQQRDRAPTSRDSTLPPPPSIGSTSYRVISPSASR